MMWQACKCIGDCCSESSEQVDIVVFKGPEFRMKCCSTE